MKTISFLLTLIFFSITLHAQNRIKDGLLKAKTTTFIGEKKRSSIIVKNQADGPKRSLSEKYWTRLSDPRVRDESAVSLAFLKVLSKKRLGELLRNEKSLGVNFYFDRSGKVKSLEYYLNPQTLITPNELESIEKNLKSLVVFVVQPSEVKDDNIWPFTKAIYFQKLYDLAKE